MRWFSGIVEQLQAGGIVQVRPRGHSMMGKISDGALVTLAPCQIEHLKTDDVVLVQIQGRRYSHLVLHQILDRREGQFLIGSHQGRNDGWVNADAILGIATHVENNA